MRKYITYFGTLFNNISVVRKNAENNAEQIISVPITYGPKMHWLTRTTQDPDLVERNNTAIQLPRISFEIIGLNYDGERKLQTLNRTTKRANTDSSLVYTQFTPVPYDINFQLTIYSKNADDALQIVEQIVPYFNPDYTATLKLIENVDYSVDVPVILASIVNEDSYEGSLPADRRYIFYTLLFNMKAYFWGPTRKGGLIKKAFVNFYTDTEARRADLTYDLNIGQFDRFEVVTQNQANNKIASGKIYFANSTILKLYEVQGNFEANTLITGSSSNAVGTVISANSSSVAGERLIVQPAMLANGSPTSNAALSVPLDLIGPEDTYGISVNIEDL